MFTTKEITKAEKEIKKILAETAAEINDLEEQINIETAALEAAERTMEKAKKEGKTEEYKKALAYKRDNEDIKEMHESRLNALRYEPLLKKEEYEKIAKSIYEEMSGVYKDKTERRKIHEKALEEIETDYLSAFNHANEVLETLQNDIYRNADRSILKNGTMLFLGSENLTFKDIYTKDFTWKPREKAASFT